MGYAGGEPSGQDGMVCYHGGPSGTMYGNMGYAEATEVQLEGDSEKTMAQFDALASKYVSEASEVVNLPRGTGGRLWVSNNALFCASCI